MDETKRTEIHDIMEHFEGHVVTQDILTEYCNLKGYAIMDKGEYDDRLFEKEHVERIVRIMPQVFAKLGEYKTSNDTMTEAERKEVSDFNEAISIAIAEIIESEGTKYREVQLMITGMKRVAEQLLTQAENRINNMCTLTLIDTAKKAVGDELVVRDMANYSREKLGYDKK